MNLLDWVLVVLVIAYALSGYWQGFITGACATAGLLLGGLLGIWLAPIALGDADPSVWVSLGALFIVIVSATLGQALFQFAGAKLRERIRWQPIRAVDAVGGAALSAAAVLLVAWALGLAVSGSRIDGITPAVRNSLVLDEVNEVLPQSATKALQAFNDVVGTSFFPRYLEPFARETIVDVGRPPQRLVRDPDVAAAAESVLKIHGDNSCGRGVEGTGFLYADNRLMTNAHVVAGVDDPEVLIGERHGRRHDRALRPRPRHRRTRLRRRRAARPRLRLRWRGEPGCGGPRLPRGRSVRRAAGPDPRRAATAIAEHLRRRFRPA